MQLLISDSNILIDLIVAEQIHNMFLLPFSFAVPDILFDEELKNDHSDLLELGLNILELTSESVAYTFTLVEQYPKPGRNDLFALALAKQENCPLVTGDKDLRDAAQDESVVLFGTIWIVEQLVRHALLTIDEAREIFEKMKEEKRRLPWSLVQAHLDALETELLNNEL